MTIDDLSPGKRLILDWIDLAIRQKNPREAFRAYASNNYRQHNQVIGDGVECVVAFFEAMNNFDGGQYDVKYMIEEGDLVVVFGQILDAEKREPLCLLADMFRIENGKLAEHWDVIQRVTHLPFRSGPLL